MLGCILLLWFNYLKTEVQGFELLMQEKKGQVEDGVAVIQPPIYLSALWYLNDNI